MHWLSEFLQFFRWLGGKKSPGTEPALVAGGSGALRGVRLPPRSRVELDASARQRQKLANFGEHDYANLPALGREQAQFIIHRLEAVVSQREDDAQLADAHRFVSNLVTYACLAVMGIVGVSMLRDRSKAESASASTLPAVATPDFEQAVADSKTRALRLHPDLGVVGSRLNGAYAALYWEWRQQHRPELDRSDWPERLAEQCDR